MATYKKKTWPDMFQKILEGKKKFDLRVDDFGVKEGDTLILEEYDPVKKEYTGRKLEKKVTYLLKTKDLTFNSKEDIDNFGFVVMSFD